MKEIIYNIRMIRAKEGNEIEVERVLNNKEQDGLLFNKVMKSFSSYSKKGSLRVYVEVSGFENERVLSKVANGKKNKDYLSKIKSLGEILVDSNMKAATGWENNLIELIDNADAIEFGFRVIKEGKRDKWLLKRKKFMGYVKKNPGFEFDFEMISIDDDITAVVFGWKDKKSFNKGAKTIFSSFGALKAMIQYFPMMKQVGFQVVEPIK